VSCVSPLGSELCFSLGCDLADEDVARANFRADAHHSVLIEIAELEFRDVGDVVCRHFGTELCIANDTDELLHVDGCESCVLGEALGDDDGVFVVGTKPRQERDADILTDSELAADRCRRIAKQSATLDTLAHRNCRTLVEGRKAVGARKIDELVLFRLAAVTLDLDALGVDVGHLAWLLGDDETP